MSEEFKDTQQRPANPTPGENGGQGGEKVFTQEDVNRIVSDRLAREREKLNQPQEDEREQALKAREARLDCREYLDSKNYPADLLDVLDSSSVDKFKAAVDKLEKIFPAIADAKATTRKGWTPGEPSSKGRQPDAIAAAFRPKI
jgi:hypothetical protein